MSVGVLVAMALKFARSRSVHTIAADDILHIGQCTSRFDGVKYTGFCSIIEEIAVRRDVSKCSNLDNLMKIA